MKKYFLGIAIAVMALVIACVKDLEDEGIYNTTKYMGVVVEKTTMQPIPGIMVQVTDGTHVHASTETDNNGKFVLKEINFEEVDTNYYLWLDGTPRDLPSKQERLRGLGNKIYDYKTLVLYDKTNADLLPTVTTNSITEVTALSAKVNCAVTRNGAREVTVRGVCYSPYQMPTIGNPVVTAGRSTGSYTCPLTRLNKNTTYYVRAYATNSIGTVYGAQMMFRTKDGNATITTTDATEIASNSALVGGNITNDGGAAITARGICWAKTVNPTISGDHTSDGTGTGSFTHRLQQLDNSTTYYYRPYATNACGTSYGPQKTFVTTSGKPTVTTGNVSNITATNAVCNGNVTSDGGFTVTAKGFCWSSTSQYPTVSNSHSSDGSGIGSFNGSLTNLQRNTTYYVRAYATNSVGTAYGSQVSFTTNSGLPMVTTTTPILSGTTVSTGGDVTSDGGFAVTARGICYGPLPNPDLTANYSHTTNGNGTGYYTSTFPLPVGSGTYYIRAYATNSSGTSYGAQMTITNPYDNLPTFTYNGHTYRVAPDPGYNMTWDNANTYCNGLELYGCSDWRLPTRQELYQMYIFKNSIGGFISSYYWSSSQGGNGYYWLCDFYDGQEGTGYSYSSTTRYRVRPIRVEN